MDQNIIKKFIQRLLFGKQIIIPLLVEIKKEIIKNQETKYILKRLRSNNFSEVVIVYDLSVSPPNYGVVFYMTMFARYFLIKGKKVIFIIINSEFRDDWATLNKEEKLNLEESFMEIPKVLFNNVAFADIRLMSWGDFSTFLERSKGNKAIFIPFKNRVSNRKPIYYFIFNLINYLMSVRDIDFLDKFLLSYENIAPNVNISIPEIPYITWQARFSNKWGMERNCSEDEFVKTYKSLKEIYPDRSIMLISDKIGCEYFKKLSDKYGFTLLFSKDFSTTFMGDVALILHSEYYFQLRGGGIGTTILYSRVPYGIILKLGYKISNEKEWSKGKLTPWATNSQNFKNAYIGVPHDVRI